MKTNAQTGETHREGERTEMDNTQRRITHREGQHILAAPHLEGDTTEMAEPHKGFTDDPHRRYNAQSAWQCTEMHNVQRGITHRDR